MKHRFGLKARFVSLIVVLLTTIFGIMAVVLIQTDSASLRQDLLARSKDFSALATKPIGEAYVTYQDSGTVLITQQIDGFVGLNKSITNVSVVDVSGATQYQLNKTPLHISVSDASSFQPVYVYDRTHAVRRIIYPFLEDDGRHQYAVVYDISSADVNTAVHKLEQSIVTYTLLGLVISAVVTYLLINRLFLIPIRQLRDQALVISAGHYSEHIVLDRHDEIGDLAQSVAKMAERLKTDILKLKEVDEIKSEFMMIASHYLRTPLTIIDGYLELAKSQALSAELRGMLDKIETNSQRLGEFAEDLLIISSIEAGQKIFKMQPVIVGKTLADAAKGFVPLAQRKHVTFNTSLDQANVTIQGSSDHLHNAVDNLLSNALKFTPANGTINLAVTHDKAMLHISVSDTGTGISPDEIDKLFTKFHRGTSTATYDYEGSGIGLYLSKLIVSEHGGTITVKSQLGKGSTFTINLPITPAS